jgi:succinoglycan biosynthesis protein ExoA
MNESIPRDPEAVLPFITVVMPVRNEAGFIRETLAQLLGQEYPPDRFEIIVADGLSDDGTADIVREISQRHPNVRLIANEGRKSSSGRNVGFLHGRGDYFIVVDGHCHIEGRHLLQDTADCFERSGADCLGRPQPLDPPDLTPIQESIALARASRLGHGGDSLIYGNHEGYCSPVSNGASYRREAIRKVGPVDERFDACEDVEFNYRIERAGLVSYMSPSLKVQYYPRESLPGLFRQMTRYGRGRVRFLRNHPETFSPPGIVPAAFVCFLAMAVMIGVFHAAMPYRFPFLAQLFYGSVGFLSLYAFLLLTVSVQLSATHGFRHLRYLPPVFFTIHFGLGWGWLTGLISDRVD